MATYQALGTGPISFVDANFSQQELPLSAIFSSPNGWDVSSSPVYTTANQPIIDALIKQLAAQGFLKAADDSLDSSSSLPHVTISAAQKGAPGNSITLAFSNVNLSKGTFDVTATATETFPNLKPSGSATGTDPTVVTALGNSAATATGLVFATDGSGLMPASYSGPPGAVSDTATPTAGTAFTLAATNSADAADAALINVNVAPGTTTFTVTVSWTKTATAQSFATLLAATTPLSYLVTFSGSSGPLPSGSVTLSGGQNASGANPAVAASANIYASS
jgi:hypothetical protein